MKYTPSAVLLFFIAAIPAWAIDAPQNIMVKKVDTSIEISWSAVSEATKYNVYRNGGYMATVNAPSTTITDTLEGVGESYTVTAINSDVTPTDYSPRPEPVKVDAQPPLTSNKLIFSRVYESSGFKGNGYPNGRTVDVSAFCPSGEQATGGACSAHVRSLDAIPEGSHENWLLYHSGVGADVYGCSVVCAARRADGSRCTRDVRVLATVVCVSQP